MVAVGSTEDVKRVYYLRNVRLIDSVIFPLRLLLYNPYV